MHKDRSCHDLFDDPLDVVAEAIEHQADLIVVHHPLPFQPLKRITSDTTTGNLLLSLIANRIAVYSAHTAYDSAQEGINQQWCQKLDIQNVKPLVEFQPKEEGNPSSSKNISQEQLGSGRYGHLPEETQLIDLAKGRIPSARNVLSVTVQK